MCLLTSILLRPPSSAHLRPGWLPPATWPKPKRKGPQEDFILTALCYTALVTPIEVCLFTDTSMALGPRFLALNIVNRVVDLFFALDLIYVLTALVTLAMLTMAPPPSPRMSSTTACEQKNWCRRFTAMRSSQYSGVTSSSLWRSS